MNGFSCSLADYQQAKLARCFSYTQKTGSVDFLSALQLFICPTLFSIQKIRPGTSNTITAPSRLEPLCTDLLQFH